MKNYFFRCTAIFILILSLGVGDMWGWSKRTYDGSTKLYISNIKPNGWSDGVWASSDDYQLNVCFKKEGDSKEYWFIPTLEAGSAKYAKGALYSITPDAGTYDYFIIVRGKPNTFTGNGGQTSDLDFKTGNFISHYKNGEGDSQVTWGSIDPRPVKSDGTGILYFDADPAGFDWDSDDWSCGTNGD